MSINQIFSDIMFTPRGRLTRLYKKAGALIEKLKGRAIRIDHIQRLFDAGQHESVHEILSPFINVRKCPGPDHLNLFGVSAYKLNKREEAKNILARLISKYPLRASKLAYFALFKIYLSDKSYTEAEKIHRLAVRYRKLDHRILASAFEYLNTVEDMSFRRFCEDCAQTFIEQYPSKWRKTLGPAYVKFRLNNLGSGESGVTSNGRLSGRYTICIPTYNRVPAIIETVNFIREASSDIPISVLDNSSDNAVYSEQQLADWAHRGVSFSRNEKNMGYTFSLLRLLRECPSEYAILTSDEDPILVAALPAFDQFVTEFQPDYVSPVFVRNKTLYRGKPINAPMSPSECVGSAFYTSGLVFRTAFVRRLLDATEAHFHLPGQVYPQILLAIGASVLGTSYWYSSPISFMARNLETNIHQEDPTGRYNGVNGRWNQFQIYMGYIDLLERTMCRSAEHAHRLALVRKHLCQVIFERLANGALREMPEIRRYTSN